MNALSVALHSSELLKAVAMTDLGGRWICVSRLKDQKGVTPCGKTLRWPIDPDPFNRNPLNTKVDKIASSKLAGS